MQIYEDKAKPSDSAIRIAWKLAKVTLPETQKPSVIRAFTNAMTRKAK